MQVHKQEPITRKYLTYHHYTIANQHLTHHELTIYEKSVEFRVLREVLSEKWK